MATINRSYSTERGIVFYADGGVCVRAEKIGGKIVSFLSSEKSVDMEDFFGEARRHGFITKTNPFFTMKEFLMLSILLLTVCGIITRNFTGILVAIWFNLCVLPHAIYIINTLFYTKCKKSSRHEQYESIMRNHGAEHMAKNFYNREERVPTSEEIMDESRICENETYNIDFIRIVMRTFMLFSFLLLHKWDYYFYFLLISIIANIALSVYEPNIFSFMQLLVTMKPGTEETELAKEAISLLDLYLHNEEEAEKVSCKNLESVFQNMLQSIPRVVAVDFETGEIIKLNQNEFGGLFLESIQSIQADIQQNYNVCKKVIDGGWMSQATITGLGDFIVKHLE